MLRNLGLSKIVLRRKMMDVAAAQRGEENVATAQEMVRLLEAIAKGTVLKKESNSELIKQLSTSKDSYIPRYLPDGVQVANKPGSLPGVRTDSGIVFAHGRPFAISVMTAWDRDERAAEREISEIALEAYRYFEMRGKSSEGRGLNFSSSRARPTSALNRRRGIRANKAITRSSQRNVPLPGSGRTQRPCDFY